MLVCNMCNVALILLFVDVSKHVVCVITAFRQNRHQRVSDVTHTHKHTWL